MAIAIIISKRIDCLYFPFFIRLKEYTVPVITMKMQNKVSPCSVSTNVKVVDSGRDESIIYLLPTTANKAPTLNPKRESILSA